MQTGIKQKLKLFEVVSKGVFVLYTQKVKPFDLYGV